MAAKWSLVILFILFILTAPTVVLLHLGKNMKKTKRKREERVKCKGRKTYARVTKSKAKISG